MTGTPTLNGLLYTARYDIPDTEIREGDLVYDDGVKWRWKLCRKKRKRRTT